MVKIEKKLVRPNVLCIGGQKCGTSWVHDCISSHPDSFMSSPKELNFFQDSANLNSDTFVDYLKNFIEGEGKQVVGESTPTYLWTYDENSQFFWGGKNKNIPGTIYENLGTDIQLIVSLRHPVDRAVSAYFHHFRQGRFRGDENILDCLNKYGIAEMGFYKRHLENWLKYFDREKFIIVYYDDIRRESKIVMDKIFSELRLCPYTSEQHQKVSNPGFSLTAINGFITINVDSDDKLNERLFLGRLRNIHDEYVIPKIFQKDIDELFKIYEQDIDYIIHLNPALDLAWRNSDIHARIHSL